jgi:hypothetical protein
VNQLQFGVVPDMVALIGKQLLVPFAILVSNLVYTANSTPEMSLQLVEQYTVSKSGKKIANRLV